jgi:hypothetical protein
MPGDLAQTRSRGPGEARPTHSAPEVGRAGLRGAGPPITVLWPLRGAVRHAAGYMPQAVWPSSAACAPVGCSSLAAGP